MLSFARNFAERVCTYLQGGGLPLFTELSSRVLFVNPSYLTREGWWAVAKARREDGNTTSTMMRTEINTPTSAAAWSAAFGAATSPGAADRAPSTLTTTVSHRPTF